MKVVKINIVDPGSIKTISDKFHAGDKCDDVIGINQRNHEPIGACYVASWTKKQGFDVSIIHPHSDNLSLEEIIAGNPELVAFSCLTFNYPITRKIVKKIKNNYPEIITVIGGYHATCIPEEICKEKTNNEKYLFDFVVAQEADWTLGDLAEFLNGKRKREDIRGKIYEQGKLQINNFSRFDPNLNPIPFRTKDMMLGRRRQGLYYPAPSQQESVALFVWSRGCPYNCEFCISAKMFTHSRGESPIRFRSIKNVIKEVRFCQDNFGTNFGFAVDLNFYGGNRDRMKKLCKKLGETGLKWYAMSRLDVDLELLEIMQAGGCTGTGFGVESLTNIRKSGTTMSIDKWKARAKEVATRMKELGMISKFYYILGGPEETLADIEAEGEAICEVFADEIRLSWMMISPGTPLFDKLKKGGGLEKNGKDLSLFSTDFPVIRVSDTTAEKLQNLRLSIYREFYSPRRYGPHARSMIASFPRLEQSFDEWDTILKQSLGRGWKE